MSKIFNHRSLFSSFKSASLASGIRYGLNLESILLPNMYYCNKRFLYSREHLGLVSFADQRSKITSQFGHLKDNLLERLKSSVEGRSRMIFSEDLKNAIFLASDDQADLDILKDVIAKYSDQSNDIKFSPYQFGPVVMRLLHVFNKPELAFELLMDDKYGDFFRRERAFLVGMDLCWNNEKYEEIIKLYERFESQISTDKRTWYTDLFVLTTGACYKMNTPESYKIATEKVLARRAKEEILGARSTCFFAALALNQNEPDVALECLSTMPRTRSALHQTLKLMCLASLKRLDDVIYSIKNVMNAEILPAKAFVLAEAIDAVDRAMDASANPETKEEWNRLGQALRDNNMISTDTVDSRLCKEIESRMILRTSDRKFAFGQNQEPRGDRGYGAQRYNRYRPQRSDNVERFSRYDDRFQNNESRYGNRRMNQFSGGYSNQRSRNYFGEEGFNDRRSRDNFEDSDDRQPQRRKAQGAGRFPDDD